MVHTVKLRTPDHVRSVKIVKNPELSWSDNLLVRNFVGQNLLVRKLCVPGIAGPKVIDIRLGNLVYAYEVCC
jgi:hypothetical protein